MCLCLLTVRKNRAKREDVDADLIAEKRVEKRVFSLWITCGEPVDSIVLLGTLTCGLYRAFRNAYFVLLGTKIRYSPINIRLCRTVTRARFNSFIYINVLGL